MTQAAWKQGKNEIELVGLLNEKSLEIKEFDEKKNGQPTGAKYNAITGSIVIKTGENENHRVEVFTKELKADGTPNKMYPGLVTIMNETVSVADKANNPEAIPSKLRVTGQFSVNDYVGQSGELSTSIRIQARFINRISDAEPLVPKATFNVEGVVKNVIEEFNTDGEPTGRKKINLYIPEFKRQHEEVGGLAPVEFVVEEGQGADYVESEFEKGSSVLVVGNMVNFRKETQIEVQMGFGTNVETKVDYKRENTVISGLRYEEGTHDKHIFDRDLITKAEAARNVMLEQKKAAGPQTSNNATPQGGFGFGNGAATPNPLTQTPSVPDVSNMFG